MQVPESALSPDQSAREIATRPLCADARDDGFPLRPKFNLGRSLEVGTFAKEIAMRPLYTNARDDGFFFPLLIPQRTKTGLLLQ